MSIHELERHVDSSRTTLGRRRIPRRGNREKDNYNEQSANQTAYHSPDPVPLTLSIG